VPLQAHLATTYGSSGPSSIWYTEPYQREEYGLQTCGQSSSALLQDERTKSSREQRQGEDVPDFSYMRLEALQVVNEPKSTHQTPDPKKRCRKMFPGRQFPHYCSQCNISFQACCIGFHPIQALCLTLLQNCLSQEQGALSYHHKLRYLTNTKYKETGHVYRYYCEPCNLSFKAILNCFHLLPFAYD
jgi:hypothetical protein